MDAWRTISVALRLDHSQYSRGTQAAASETKKLGAEVEQTQRKMGTGWDTTSRGLRKVNQDLKATETQAERTGKSGMGLKSALLGIGVGVGIRKLVTEYEQAEVTGARTAAVIKSTGNAAEVSAAQQDKMVQSLSKTAAIDDEVIAGGANVLRTFTQIRGAETFERSLKAATDMNAALGGGPEGLQGRILMVGKALNDPATGFSKLQRAGVSFTESQKEQIKTLQASGDRLGAQKIILNELEKEFGGAAAASATDSAKMKVAVDNAAESLGTTLAPALTLTAKAIQVASAGLQALPGPLQMLVVAGIAAALVGGKISEAWQTAGSSLKSAGSALTGSVSDFGNVKSAALAADVGIAAFQTTLELLNGLVDKTDVSGLASDIKSYGDGKANLDDLGLSVEGLASEFQLAYKNSSLAERGWNAFRSAATGNVDGFKQIRQAQTDIEGLDSALAEAVKSGNIAQAKKLYGDLAAGLISQGVAAEDVAAFLPKYNNEMERATRENKAGADSAKDHAEQQKILAGALDLTSGSAADQAKAARTLYDAWTTADDATQAYQDSIVAVADAEAAERQAKRDQQAAVAGVASANRDLAAARRAVGDAEAQVGTAIAQVAAAQRSVAEAEKARDRADADVLKATQDLAAARRAATGDSDAMRSALQSVDAAERTLAAAQRQSLTDQQALDRARQNYGQTLSDLKDQADGSADAVERAQIRLRKAKADAAAANADPTKTADDRASARLDVADAERAVRAAQEQAAAALEEYNRNQAAGVNGSDAVVAAQDRVTASTLAVADANRGVVSAVQNVADTQTAATAAVASAEQNLADKLDARRAADQRIIDARAAVVEAEGGVQKAREQVATATQSVADKQVAVNAANDKVVESADKVVAAHGKVKGAVDEVGKKALALADAQYQVDVKTKGATEAGKLYLDRLKEITRGLDPNGSAYRNLLGYVELLQWQHDLENPKGGKPTAGGSNGSIFGFLQHRTGGIDQAFAKGGIYAHVQRGQRIRYAEPETGGEAYIPRLGDKARGLAVLAEAATWYGMGLRPLSGGGGFDWNGIGADPSMHWNSIGPDPTITWGGSGSTGTTVANLPSSAEGQPMYDAMHEWASTHSPVGVNRIIPHPIPDSAGRQFTIDYPELARAIADAIPVTVAIQAAIDATGLTPGSAATLVGAELAAKVSAATTKGRR